MIWATVSSRSCFCWQYKASPPLAAKNIIHLISVRSMCRVFSCVVVRCLSWPVRSLGKTLLAFALHTESYSKLSQKIVRACTAGNESQWVSEVTQSCPALCNPMDCSLQGSSVHGIFQARVLEWIAISFSRGSSWPRDRTRVSRIAGRRFTVWVIGEV